LVENFRAASGPRHGDGEAAAENTDLRRMNDLPRAHAKFDAGSGVVSVSSELDVKNGWVEGYVKPLERSTSRRPSAFIQASLPGFERERRDVRR